LLKEDTRSIVSSTAAIPAEAAEKLADSNDCLTHSQEKLAVSQQIKTLHTRNNFVGSNYFLYVSLCGASQKRILVHKLHSFAEMFAARTGELG
jgi:hypothetical protein